ncbi:MAG TPA: DNA-formamidopyrimidine glycosylase family protein [Actinomycetota bacterium]|nr:DNA-formamidopyrimidine glycosylase family protein [Actinomycetota bacterium]
MPEGDTITRTARTLDRALAGRRLVRFQAPRLPAATLRPSAGSIVLSARARGKHLLIDFSDGSTLHTHMRMHGSWHVYQPGERWRLPPAAMRAMVQVEGAVAVCFRAPVVEVLEGGALRRHPQLTSLGPDLCAPAPDLDAAVEGLGRLLPGSTQIGVALLDQRAAAGIGNVYKSEVLFACGIDPFTPVTALDEATRRRVVETAARLLRANLDARAPRRTVPEGLAVYGRAGRPCRRCGTPIRSRKQGEAARATYWCPACQPAIVPEPAP